MNEKILLFDIDKTIFNTETFGKKIIKRVEEVLQITNDEAENIFHNYKSKLKKTTDFNPDDLIKEVANETKKNLNLVSQAVFSPDNFVLYPETRYILEQLNKRSSLLGVYSEGILEWQKKKIILTKLIGYFDPSLLIIERRKLSSETINRLPNRSTIVDDKKEVIEMLTNMRPDLNLVWINRQNKEKLETPKIKTIKNLKYLL